MFKPVERILKGMKRLALSALSSGVRRAIN